MPECQSPLFLARERKDAEELHKRLADSRIEAETLEVIVGDDRRGWQVLVPEDALREARTVAAAFEAERYGQWQSRQERDAVWGVVDDEEQLFDPTQIYSAQSVMQAHFLKNLLAERGIDAVVTNQMLHGGAGIDLVGTPTAAKVVVAAEDADTARAFALEFDERTRAATAAPTLAPDDESETAWPTCPGCKAKRTTRCPICGTSGTDFSEADRGFLGELSEAAEGARAGSSCGCSGSCSGTSTKAEYHDTEEAEHAPHEDDASELLLMCSVCDEPFKPEYPRHCEWCGHEFPEGYVIERIVGPEEIPNRAIAVAIVLGLLLLASLVYFVVIL